MNSIKSEINKRNAGIDLLKLIAMFFIIISHSTPEVAGRLSETAIAFINGNICSADWQYIFIGFSHYLGAIGNAIFISTSAWFLLDSKNINTAKIISMVIDVFAFSLINWTIVSLSGKPVIINKALFFPISSGNNWFIECYIVLYLLHPIINTVIESLKKYDYFKILIIMIFIYSIWQFVVRDSFYNSDLISFILIYLCTAYSKKYGKNWKYNKALIGSTFFLLIAIGIVNLVGLHFNFANDWLQIGARIYNPLNIILSISMVHIFNKFKFNNKIVSQVSQLTLLIYIIHEDINIRNFIKPYYWLYVYEKWGYKYLFLEIIMLTICSTIISIIVAFVWTNFTKKTKRKISQIIADNYECVIQKLYNFIK